MKQAETTLLLHSRATMRESLCSACAMPTPPPPPPDSANLAANESAARLTRLGERDQNFGGWHKIKPIMRCWLCRCNSILH